jgi:hypothetical protein
MQLAGLAPTSPNVYNPVAQYYSVNININYTASMSPNSYEINNYTIKVYDTDFTELSTLSTTNDTTLGYIWDTDGVPNRDYIIGVSSCDTLNQCSSIGYSQQFTLNNSAPTITINYPDNITYTTTLDIPLNITVTYTTGSGAIWYNIDNGNNITYTEPTTFPTTLGGHIVKVWANDTANSVGSATVAFTLSISPPVVTINLPLASTYNQINSIPLNISSTSVINIDKVWYSIDSGSNTTYSGVGTFNTVAGNHVLRAYANDTLGSVGQATIYFTTIAIPPSITNFVADPYTTTSNTPITFTITAAAGEGTLDKVWFKSNNVIQDISEASVGSNQFVWITYGVVGVQTIYAYVNNTNNEVATSNKININFVTTTTIMPLPPTIPNNPDNSSITYGVPTTDCYDKLMRFELIEAALCPFKNVWGGDV